MQLTQTLLEKPNINDPVVRERIHKSALKDVHKPRTLERNYRAGRALMALLAVVAGTKIYQHESQPATRTVDMIVQPYDNPTTVSQRAENEYGKDPGDFNVPEEASRLSSQYGILHAGEHLKVHIK
jgi:hypothetical protein